MLQVNIKKRLQSFTLCADFELQEECLGVSGASGSGKSMLLKCIAGIEQPDEGRIVLNDQVLFDSERKINLPPRKRKIGYLFQSYALFPNMTVEKNLSCVVRGEKEQVDYLIQKFELEEIKNRYPKRLSGGQKQRTALARLLASEPEVILLDEPFNALDEELKQSVMEQTRNWLTEYGRPAILVSHDKRELALFCERKLKIKDGKQTEDDE